MQLWIVSRTKFHYLTGEVHCVECDSVALSYCTMFEDYMCLACFARLHQKGHRKDAKAYKLEVCSLCKSKAAKLQCGYTGKLFCLEYLFLLLLFYYCYSNIIPDQNYSTQSNSSSVRKSKSICTHLLADLWCPRSCNILARFLVLVKIIGVSR